MANPLEFVPKVADPRTEHELRLRNAPTEHAEAALVAWDVLQAAHDQGLLDLLHGAIGSKDIIAEKITDYAKLPEGIAGVRNLLAIAKILTVLDPETLNCLANSLDLARLKHEGEQKPPSLFKLARRVASEDSRRGLSFLTLIVAELGKSLKA